ncbi:hypothetical protein ACFL0Q_07000 [Thermodesulfobacteriota bacterium]
MNEDVEKIGAHFLLVTVPHGIQVHPDPTTRTEFVADHGIPDLYYATGRIEKYCRERGIRVVNLETIFLDHARQRKVFLHGFENTGFGFGHWNLHGHELAARVLAEYICSEKMLTLH